MPVQLAFWARKEPRAPTETLIAEMTEQIRRSFCRQPGIEADGQSPG